MVSGGGGRWVSDSDEDDGNGDKGWKRRGAINVLVVHQRHTH